MSFKEYIEECVNNTITDLRENAKIIMWLIILFAGMMIENILCFPEAPAIFVTLYVSASVIYGLIYLDYMSWKIRRKEK